ncbi:MAG: tetratricopeptide repeat protein [Xanthobacteraceae bacterium]|nr:tetratricopeptide repeat protein [Xanthobacteraceae bacterium]
MAGQASLLSATGTSPGSSLNKRLSTVCERAIRAGRWIVLAVALVAQPGAVYAEPIKANISLSSPNNTYGRLILQFAEPIQTEVTVAGSILVIRFAKPVDVSVDDLGDALPSYVGSARGDPDGSAIRLALTQAVKVNTMTAGERVFIDLLPEKWTGPPPGLPQELIKELSDRAMAAERALRAQQVAAETKKPPTIRVRAAVQPTFVRFAFELPEGINVSSALNADKYTLSFSSPLNFDLADAKVTAPSNVKSIAQAISGEVTTVEIGLIGEVDVHGFRDDRDYVVDIGFDPEKRQSVLPASILPLQAESAPAKSEPNNAPAPPERKTSDATPREEREEAPPAKDANKGAEHAKAADEASKPASPLEPPQVAQAAVEPAPSKQAIETLTKPAPKADTVSASTEDTPSTPVVPPVQEQPKLHEQPQEQSREQAQPQPQKSAGLPVTAKRTTEDLRIVFPFETSTPVAVFRRSDAVWMVVADSRPLDLNAVTTEGGNLIGSVMTVPVAGGQAIRIKLNRPQLPSIGNAGQYIALTLAERDQAAPQSLIATHNVADPTIANVSIAFANPGPILHVTDPDIGDTLSVVTGQLPARGFRRRQNFVEFSILESTQGVVVLANSDDVVVQPTPDKVLITRPGGLTLSAANVQPERAAAAISAVFDANEWEANQKAPFFQRLDELINAVSTSSGDKRLSAYMALANFYMAHGFYQEAKGAMDAVLSKPSASTELPTAIMIRAAAEALGGRSDLALKDLNDPAVGSGFDSQMWKGVATARLGKWAEAREKFKNSEFSVITLPLDLQRIVLVDGMRAFLAVKDYAGATARSNDLQTLGVALDQAADVALLRGRLSEALGREKDALSNYHEAAVSDDRPVAAEAVLAEIALRQKRHEIGDDEARHDLEVQSVMWRGDATEAKTLRMLSRLYIKKGAYSDALASAMLATKIDPNSESARSLQDDAAALFSEIFLTDKGNDLPPIKALGLFYQYRDLTPIGRRGDEMIRRLADRLAAVDLLDQAGDLLQYQVDKRLEGAARAQVAARLAMVYLTNRKPERAIAALRSTRIGDLAGELRQQRLLLEARAQSDVGRNDLALDIISNMTGREAIRLRSDIYWAMRKWRESAEQIEILYGDRWKDFRPLTDIEKGDIIRAAIGYALASDSIGLSRFREKYAPKMETEADKSAFAIAGRPSSGDTADLERIAKMAAQVDTLEGFLREMRQRFPDGTARAKAPGAEADTTGSLPQIVGTAKASGAH